MNKPHLVLDWKFDMTNHTTDNSLTCEIGDNLKYIAYAGGSLPFTKIHNGITTTITPEEWINSERHWISENYGELVGYFQPDQDRVITHPIANRPDRCVNGLGPDGRYLDHLQRMQIVMEGNDMARIWGGVDDTLFLTPDCGKTIYKRMLTRDVYYEKVSDPNMHWPETPQPCMMQPRSSGCHLSNYAELKEAGADEETIEKCRNGLWAAPQNPELQQLYKYPTE